LGKDIGDERRMSGRESEIEIYYVEFSPLSLSSFSSIIRKPKNRAGVGVRVGNKKKGTPANCMSVNPYCSFFVVTKDTFILRLGRQA
jgi:hypothetical protein